VSAAKVENVVEIAAAGRAATVRHEGIVHRDRVESERREEIVHRVHKGTVHHGPREIVRRAPRANAHHEGSAHRDRVVKDRHVHHGPREIVRRAPRANAHHEAAGPGVLNRLNSRRNLR
jgi:hypothetical protein